MEFNENKLNGKILEAITAIVNQISSQSTSNWLSMKEAAKYAGVSYNTLMKFPHKGLKICKIDGIKRVSKKEIDRFLDEHSF
ncbi:helix-turn-helix domain-containing protein [Lysinibacillus cavernae]|uniref:helix-turn-helix domain-containing protein n=1 Tax=Lysinibacillus cavernae TaxID=2666135 RepID=UPI0012D886D0|nr:helix-turn-helix domain-containing protein [Lysinibacillus cavernae]